MSRIQNMLAVALLTVVLASCGNNRGGAGHTLDSAGSTIERGAEQVGGKLDTAFRAVRRKVIEAQLQSAIQQFRGLEHVSLALSEDSIATLTGAVASDSDRHRAVLFASQLQGVRAVSNAIGIADSTTFQAPRDSDAAGGKKHPR